MHLSPMRETRGPQRQFPPPNHSLRDRDGKEDAGSTDVVVVEKINHIGAKIVRVDYPSVIRNGDAKLMFLVALAVESCVSQPLLAGEVDQRRTGDGFDRWSLIVMSIEGAEGPSYFWNRDGGTEAWLDCGFVYRRSGCRAGNIAFGKARRAHSGGEREPRKRLELVVDIKSFEIGVGMFDIGERNIPATVVEDRTEKLVIALVEAEKPNLQIVFLVVGGEAGLPSPIVRAAIFGRCQGRICGLTAIITAVVVVEGRERCH